MAVAIGMGECAHCKECGQAQRIEEVVCIRPLWRRKGFMCHNCSRVFTYDDTGLVFTEVRSPLTHGMLQIII